MQSGTGIADMTPMDIGASGTLVEAVGAGGGSNQWEASGGVVPENIVNNPQAEEAQKKKNSKIRRKAQKARGEAVEPKNKSKKKYDPNWFEKPPPGK